MGKITERLAALLPAKRREMEICKEQAAMFLQAEIRRAVSTPGSPGRPSRPGDAPHKVTGGYQRSLFARSTPAGIVVGSTDAARFRALEFGTSKMAARPAVYPTVERTRAKVLDIIRGR